MQANSNQCHNPDVNAGAARAGQAGVVRAEQGQDSLDSCRWIAWLRTALLALLAGLLFAFDVGCIGGNPPPQTPDVPAAVPRITSFTAVATVVRAGSSTLLRWEAVNAEIFRVSWLDQSGTLQSAEIGPLAREYQTPSLQADATFTLRAVKLGTSPAEETLRVRVSPAIVRLTALPASVLPGQTTTITYRVLGTPTRLIMSPGDIELPVDASGTFDQYWITPALTTQTTFSLTAINAAGSDSVQLSIPVGNSAQPPQIQSFTASPATISPGGSTTLAWSILGQVDNLVLNPGDVRVGTTGGHRVDGVVAGANTFTLTATNAAGSTSASLTVNLDTSGATIRITPATATTPVGVPVALSALVTGLSNPSVNWSSTPSAGATWSQAAGGTPTWRFTQTGTYVVRATSVERPDLWAEATVTVLPEAVSVALSPPSTILKAFGTQAFLASVAGTADHRLFWTSSGGGAVTPGADGTAVFQASELPGTFQVTATSLATPSGTSATAAVTVPDHTSYIQYASLTTTTATLSRSQIPAGGEVRRFAAMITGTSPGGAASFNGGWDWEVTAAAGTARTVGYSCVQPPGSSCSSMHTIEWLVPASVPVGTHTLRLRPWSNPTIERTLTLTVNP